MDDLRNLQIYPPYISRYEIEEDTQLNSGSDCQEEDEAVRKRKRGQKRRKSARGNKRKTDRDKE